MAQAAHDDEVELETLERIRMSLDLTPAMKAIIDDLARQEGASRSEVLRRAIALLKAIKDAQKKGEQPVLVDREGHVTARLVGI
jgi:Arc/MetJ-type ribon-helix-helix transcriptional regulator